MSAYLYLKHSLCQECRTLTDRRLSERGPQRELRTQYNIKDCHQSSASTSRYRHAFKTTHDVEHAARYTGCKLTSPRDSPELTYTGADPSHRAQQYPGDRFNLGHRYPARLLDPTTFVSHSTNHWDLLGLGTVPIVNTRQTSIEGAT